MSSSLLWCHRPLSTGSELPHLILRATLGGYYAHFMWKETTIQSWSHLPKGHTVWAGRVRIRFQVHLLLHLCSYHCSISSCLPETSVLGLFVFCQKMFGIASFIIPHASDVPSLIWAFVYLGSYLKIESSFNFMKSKRTSNLKRPKELIPFF